MRTSTALIVFAALVTDSVSSEHCLGQTVHTYAKLDRDNMCGDEEPVLAKGQAVKVWHEGGAYPTINRTELLNWPSDSLRRVAGRDAWGEFEVQPGDTGSVISELPPRKGRHDPLERIYLVLIRGRCVPIKCSYLTGVPNLDSRAAMRLHAEQVQARMEAYAAGCPFKANTDEDCWTRAGIFPLDIASESFACDLRSQGVDTVMLCKHILDNGGNTHETAYVFWYSDGKGYARSYTLGREMTDTGSTQVPTDWIALLTQFTGDSIAHLLTEPSPQWRVSHCIGYAVRLSIPGSFYCKRYQDAEVLWDGGDLDHPVSKWWQAIDAKVKSLR